MPKGPGWAHRQVLWIEPTRLTSTVIGATVALTGAAAYAGVQSAEDDDPAAVVVGPSIVTIVSWAGPVLVVLGLLLFVFSLRRLLAAHGVRELLTSERGRDLQPDGRVQLADTLAQPIPELYVARRGRLKWRGRAYRVTETTNVLGRPPLHIAYLRLFGNQPRGRNFLASAWRELGPVYFLRGASSVGPRELKAIQRNPDKEFVDSVEELRRVIARAGTHVTGRGLRRFPDLAPTAVTTWDRYGAYAPVPVLCHGSAWKDVVDELLIRVDLVCLDLSGFQEQNEGTAYEVQRVVDRYPIERVVFLCDPQSDVDFLERAIRLAWSRMAVDSPNEGSRPRTTTIARTDVYVITTRTDQNTGAQTSEKRLKADRKSSRALGEVLQKSLATLPAAPGEPWVNRTTWSSSPQPQPQNRIGRVLLGAVGVLVGAAFVVGAYFGPQALAQAERDIPGPFPTPTGHVTPSPTPDPSPDPPNPPPSPDPSEDTVVVPTLRELTREEAEQRLHDADLLTEVEEVHSGLAAGLVDHLVPLGGTEVPRRSTVTIFVADGFTMVPDVIGEEVTDATDTLEDAGLAVVVERLVDETAVADTVIAQDTEDVATEEDGSVKVGTEVTITVATGPTDTVTESPSESPGPSPSPTLSPTP